MSGRDDVVKRYAERALEEEANEIWSKHTNSRADRHTEWSRLEELRDSDYDEYVRSGGADRLLELMNEGG